MDNTWNFKQGNGMKSCTDIGGEALEIDWPQGKWSEM